MGDERDELADRLLNAEPADADRLASLRQEMTAMIELKWSPAKRVMSAVGGAFLCVLGVGSGVAFVHGSQGDPLLIRATGAIATLVCAALGVLMIALARRGSFHRRRHNSVFMLLAVVILGGLALIFLNEGWSSNDARLQFTGQLMLALLGFSIILHFMEQNQLSTTQRLLELEYRLAQMGERLDSSRRGLNDR